MFTVVIMHVCTQGGVLDSLTYGTLSYYCVWVLMCITYCANNTFALLSGYLYDVSKRKTIPKAVLLWVNMFFYTIIISLVFFIIDPSYRSVENIIKAITPVTSGQYWYLSAYFGLIILMPLLNYCLDNLEGRALHTSAITVVVVFSLLPTLRHTDPFGINNGWSSAWLAIMYYFGGYTKKTNLLSRVPLKKAVRLFSLSVAIASGSKFLIEFIVSLYIEGNNIYGGGYLISLTSPVIIAESLFLIAVFEKITITKPVKVISTISSSIMSVYLIHQHPFIKHLFISGRFAVSSGETVLFTIAKILLGAAIIFSICVMLDYVRATLFRKMLIKDRINRCKWMQRF